MAMADWTASARSAVLLAARFLGAGSPPVGFLPGFPKSESNQIQAGGDPKLGFQTFLHLLRGQPLSAPRK